MFAEIILPLAASSRLSYHIPQSLEGLVSVGSLVRVPMGKSSVQRGIVVDIGQNSQDIESSYRDIISVERSMVVDSLQLKMWDWVSQYYCCSSGYTMRRFLPTPMWGKVADVEPQPLVADTIELVKLKADNDDELATLFDSIKKSKIQSHALSQIVEMGIANQGYITIPLHRLKECNVSRTTLRQMQKREILDIVLASNPAIYYDDANLLKRPYSEDYTQELEQMLEPGVTTLIEGCAQNRSQLLVSIVERLMSVDKDCRVLILVADSRDGEAIIDILRRELPYHIIPYFGSMSTQARSRSYLALLEQGGKSIIVGTREAVGLPLNSLSGIIVENEHSNAYKQNHTPPLFHARDSAVMLGQLHSAAVVLMSETPSLETMHNVAEGKYMLHQLGVRTSPKVTIIDRRSIARDEKRGVGEDSHTRYISNYLHQKIVQTLEQGERVLLYHARRGFSQYMLCIECGEVARCPKCNVSLTYHKAKGALDCHYCDYSIPMRGVCPSCQSANIKLKGVGTENIEERVAEAFPLASICRIDSDTKKSVTLADSADIVIGTQMVRPNRWEHKFALSAIINSDTLLNIPDFRATERAMQTIADVKMMTAAGGELVVQGTLDQTQFPMMIRAPYRDIYPSQITERKIFAYPPITKMIAILLSHKLQDKVIAVGNFIYGELRKDLASRVSPLEAPFVEFSSGEYHRHLLVKIERTLPAARVKDRIEQVIALAYGESNFRGFKVLIDVDPKQT